MPRKPPAHRRSEPAPARGDDDFAFHFRPRNAGQVAAVANFPHADVLNLVGPSGTGKTVVAIALAIGEVRRKQAEMVTVVRACVEAADSELGWLGGKLDEKLSPHYLAFDEAIRSIAFNFPPKRLRQLAISFARGLTFSNQVVILDEAQNCTFRELKLILTRLGEERAKLIVCGDPEQVDVDNSGLEEFVGRLDGAEGVRTVRFGDEDIVRHPHMGEWLCRLR